MRDRRMGVARWSHASAAVLERRERQIESDVLGSNKTKKTIPYRNLYVHNYTKVTRKAIGFR